MNKRRILFACVLCLLLSGCESNAKDKIDRQIDDAIELNTPTIQKDSEYIAYQQGDYNDNNEDLGSKRIFDPNDGDVCVTLAKNSFISPFYYLDADDPIGSHISGDKCNLNPGSSIFVSDIECKNPNTSYYTFDRFDIWYYEEGDKIPLVQEAENDPTIVYTIPKDFSADNLTIAPLGKFQSREINLSAYYINGDIRQTLYDGRWTINDNEVQQGKVAISPVEPYKVSFDFYKYAEDYYFLESNPRAFFYSDDSGIVKFKSVDADEECSSFEIRLEKYKTISLSPDQDVKNQFSKGKIEYTVTQNKKNITHTTKRDDKDTYTGLKSGDVLVIRIDKEYKLDGSDSINIGNPIQLSNQYEYSITVPDKGNNNSLSIKISKRNSDPNVFEVPEIKNGIVSIRYPGHEDFIKDGAEKPGDNQKVIVRVTPVNGYYIDGKNVKENVYEEEMEYSSFDVKKIEKTNPIKPYIRITLVTDDIGVCKYTLDGETVSGTIRAKSGQVLKLTYSLDRKSGYQIVQSNRIISFISPYKATGKLVIDETFNNSTVGRSDYFNVKEK